MNLTATVATIAILAVLVALLSTIEAAIARLKKPQVDALAEQRPKLNSALTQIVRQRDQVHDGLVVAVAVTMLALAGLGIYFIDEFILPTGVSRVPTQLGAFLGVVLLCDILPKVIGFSAPRAVLTVFARPLIASIGWLLPTTRLLRRFGDASAAKIFPKARPIHPSQIGREDAASELETLVGMRTEAGVIGDDEAEMIHEVIRLGGKITKDCMTPRLDAGMLAADTEPHQLRTQLLAMGHRWVPVYHDDRDDIIGILNVRELLKNDDEEALQRHLQPPVYVPENGRVLQLFEDQLGAPESLAIVLDEYGGVEGVVTHSDILEDILEGVAPASGHPAEIQPLGKGRYIAAGAARIDELEDLIGRSLGGEGLDTLGGLIFNHIGQIPEKLSCHEVAGLRFTVRKVRRNRIVEMLIEVSDWDEVTNQSATSVFQSGQVARPKEGSTS